MKTIYFSLLFIIFCTLVKAQPVITQENYPAAGISYPATGINGAPWTPGLAGESQNWDFKEITGLSINSTFTYSLPSATPHAATFASSDIALTPFFMQYSFFLSSLTDFQISGTVSNLGSEIKRPYTNPHKIVKFPFTFGNNFKDTAKTGIYTFSTTVKQMRTIHSETVADAYGDITLPGGTTYMNVLRLKIITETIDSNYSNTDVFTGRDISNDTSYYWVSPNHKPHVFVLTKSVQKNETTILAQYFTTPTVLATMEESYSSYFNLYPNPLSNQLSIEVEDELLRTKQNLKFTLLNNKGVEVMSSPINTNKIILQKDNLSSGLYYYKITSKKEILSTGKLSVQ